MFSYTNCTLVVKTREPKDEQLCITVHIIWNIHDTCPLDIQDKVNTEMLLPYVTSGLILDFKTKGGDPNYSF